MTTTDHTRDLQARLDAALGAASAALGLAAVTAPGYARLLGSAGLGDDYERQLAEARRLRDLATGEG